MHPVTFQNVKNGTVTGKTGKEYAYQPGIPREPSRPLLIAPARIPAKAPDMIDADQNTTTALRVS